MVSPTNSSVDGRPSPSAGTARPQPVIFCWSGGKDSALALAELRLRPDVDVVALVTTFSEGYDRVCMHGVRRALLQQQAASIGLPLHEVWLSQGASNEEYESKIERAFRSFQADGVRTVAFGDIFLEDLKAYRDRHLARMDLTGLYPIWKRDSRALIGQFVREGWRAVLTCIDASVLPDAFAGREIDGRFAADLPGNVDPCGENGEFHSFVFDGPIFREPIAFDLGATRRDGRFFFRDLVPADASAPRERSRNL